MFDTQAYVVDDGAEFVPSCAPAPSAESSENWDNVSINTDFLAC